MKEKSLVLPLFQMPVAGLTSKRRRVKRSRSAAIVATNLLVCSAIVWTMFVITKINLLYLCYIKNILYLFYFGGFFCTGIHPKVHAKALRWTWGENTDLPREQPELVGYFTSFWKHSCWVTSVWTTTFRAQWVLIISPLANYHFVC